MQFHRRPLPIDLAIRFLLTLTKSKEKLFEIWDPSRKSDTVLQFVSSNLTISQAKKCLIASLQHDKILSAHILLDKYPQLSSNHKLIKSVLSRLYLLNTPPSEQTKLFFLQLGFDIQSALIPILNSSLYFHYPMDKSLCALMEYYHQFKLLESCDSFPTYLRRQFCVRIILDCPNRFLPFSIDVNWISPPFYKLPYWMHRIFHINDKQIIGCRLPLDAMKIVLMNKGSLPHSCIYNPFLSVQDIKDLSGIILIDFHQYTRILLNSYQVDKALQLNRQACLLFGVLPKFVSDQILYHSKSDCLESTDYLNTLETLLQFNSEVTPRTISMLLENDMTKSITLIIKHGGKEFVRSELSRRQILAEMEKNSDKEK